MKTIRSMLAVLVLGTALGSAAAYAADKENKDIVLKGDARCTECHDEADAPELLRIGKTRHGVTADSRNPTCTSCHGESDAHVDYKGSDKPPKPDVYFGKNSKMPAAAANEACLSCHQGGKHINWQMSTHANRNVTCTSCHDIHTQHDKVRDKQNQAEVCYSCHKEQRAQLTRPSRHPVPEGKMTCSSCHEVHGDNPKQMIGDTVNETCYSCHMEKRGPFVHNHQPVTEDCGICHNPHGTTVPNLLKARAPFLCQQCHQGTHSGQAAALPISATPTSRDQLNLAARSCMNCHTNIHGGNSTQNAATAGRFRR